MAVLTIGITSGIPSSGTGTVSTIDNMLQVAGTPSSNVLTVQGSSIGLLLASSSPGVTTLGQTTMAGSLPVTIASDQTGAQHVTGTSGFIVTPFTLFSSNELVSLASSITVLSSISGSSGRFTQTNFSNAKMGLIWFTAGSSFVPTAGGNISGWWLHSLDGGTSFEKMTSSNFPMPRPPDFIIPFSTAAAVASSDIFFATGTPLLPWDTVRVVVQNNTGVALSSVASTITVGPVSDRF